MTRIIGIATLTLLAYETTNANLITNGGFELPAVVGGLQEFHAPSSDIPGWSVTGGSVDVVMSGSVLGNAHSGLQLIDINGLSAGTIQQAFVTVPGMSYLVSVQYSNNPNPAGALPSYSALVTVFGSSTLFQQTLVHAGATETDMNWLPFSQSFRANSATTTLKLQSLEAGFGGIYFDSVEVIHEPTLVGDYNSDGTVNAADYAVWRDKFGTLVEEGTGPDGNYNGFVDSFDRLIWQEHFGEANMESSLEPIPEPVTIRLAIFVLVVVAAYRNQR